jgi:hypothetical protein
MQKAQDTQVGTYKQLLPKYAIYATFALHIIRSLDEEQ